MCVSLFVKKHTNTQYGCGNQNHKTFVRINFLIWFDKRFRTDNKYQLHFDLIETVVDPHLKLGKSSMHTISKYMGKESETTCISSRMCCSIHTSCTDWGTNYKKPIIQSRWFARINIIDMHIGSALNVHKLAEHREYNFTSDKHFCKKIHSEHFVYNDADLVW